MMFVNWQPSLQNPKKLGSILLMKFQYLISDIPMELQLLQSLMNVET